MTTGVMIVSWSSYQRGYRVPRFMIRITPTAAAEIARLSAQHGVEPPRVRIGYDKGGCSGWVYCLDFHALAPHSDDLVYACEGIQVILASPASFHLQHLQVDYSEDLMGGSFRFDNPDVQSVCNCGQSFAIAFTETALH